MNCACGRKLTQWVLDQGLAICFACDLARLYSSNTTGAR